MKEDFSSRFFLLFIDWIFFVFIVGFVRKLSHIVNGGNEN